VAAAGSTAEAGIGRPKASPKRKRVGATSTAPTPATRAVYRLLLIRGLAPAEAASLTAFMCGLPTTDLRWSLKQLNQLLFLRSLRQKGRFGGDDGEGQRPH
jgi:hypothetical protein